MQVDVMQVKGCMSVFTWTGGCDVGTVKELQVRLVAVIQVNECCRYVFIWASGFDTGTVNEQQVSIYLGWWM